jgi:hypothetical protein
MLKLEGAHASANSVSKDLENMSRGALRGNTRAEEAHEEFFQSPEQRCTIDRFASDCADAIINCRHSDNPPSRLPSRELHTSFVNSKNFGDTVMRALQPRTTDRLFLVDKKVCSDKRSTLDPLSTLGAGCGQASPRTCG